MQLGTAPDPLRFYVNENEQFIEPVPLDKPSLSQAALINWLTDLLTQAFSFNYSNQSKVESILQDYLDSRGLETYRAMFENDRDLKTIKEKKMVVSVQLTASPEVVRESVVRGRYMWQIRAPIRIVMRNALISSMQERKMEFLIWRVPETDAPIGVRVTRFSAQLTRRQLPKAVPRSGL